MKKNDEEIMLRWKQRNRSLKLRDMKKNDEEIIGRLSNIEEVLKMLLVNDVLGKDEIQRIEEDILKNARDVLLPLGIENPRLYYIEKKYYIFAEVEKNSTLSDIKTNYLRASEILTDVKIILTFESVCVQAKSFFEKFKISFSESSGEMRIY